MKDWRVWILAAARALEGSRISLAGRVASCFFRALRASVKVWKRVSLPSLARVRVMPIGFRGLLEEKCRRRGDGGFDGLWVCLEVDGCG